MPLRGIAVSAIERSATAREHKKMLLVICRYLYFKIAIITRIFPILEIVINHDIAWNNVVKKSSGYSYLLLKKL